MAIATFEMHSRNGLAFYAVLGWALLALLSAVVVVLTGKTLIAAKREQVCIPE
jgi:tellurite resistance protein